eukprot:TRINITY_DN4271_c0_g1_i2.p1 TRINITY_DN4271_c0_g1~~TRINITY_DN4271_c0_g1_i2.p1  ORF type:complete len:1558 (+),score=628.74 TRINITY_DN4271_c0_g1_i2:380-5053(+)
MTGGTGDFQPNNIDRQRQAFINPPPSSGGAGSGTVDRLVINRPTDDGPQLSNQEVILSMAYSDADPHGKEKVVRLGVTEAEADRRIAEAVENTETRLNNEYSEEINALEAERDQLEKDNKLNSEARQRLQTQADDLKNKLRIIEKQHKSKIDEVSAEYEQRILQLDAESQRIMVTTQQQFNATAQRQHAPLNHMIQQVEELNSQIEESQARFELERLEWRRDKESALSKAEEQWRTVIQEKENQHKRFETKISELQKLMSEARKEASVATLHQQQAEVSREEAQAETKRLRQDLVMAKQSAQMATTMMIDGEGGTQKAPTRSVSELEGIVRKLEGEAVFLNQQMATEVECRNKLREEMQKRVEEENHEKEITRLKMLAIEETRADEIAKVERRWKLELDAARHTQTRLEDRMGVLQREAVEYVDQISEMRKNNISLSQRNSELEGEQMANKSKITSLDENLKAARELESTLQTDLAKLRGDMANAEANEQRMESTIEFLKNELKAEGVSKTELHSTIEELREQHEAAEEDMRQLEAMAESTRVDDRSKWQKREADLRKEQIRLQGEVMELTEQLNESNDRTSNAEKQSELDQATLDELRNSLQRTEDRLNQSQHEYEMLRQRLQDTQTRHKKNISAMQSAMDEMEVNKNDIINELQGRIDTHGRELIHTKENLVSMQSSATKTTLEQQKQTATVLLRGYLDKLGTMSIFGAFKKWKEETLASRANECLKEEVDKVKKESMDKTLELCDAARSEAEAEHMSDRESLAQELSIQHEKDLKKKLDDQRAELRVEFDRSQSDMKSVVDSLADKLKKAQEDHTAALRAQLQMSETKAKNELQEKLEEAHATLMSEHQAELERFNNDSRNKIQATKVTGEREKEFALAEAEKEARRRVENMRQEMEDKLKDNIRAELQSFNLKQEKLKAEAETHRVKSLAAQKEKLDDQREKELREAQTKHRRALEKAVAIASAELEAAKKDWTKAKEQELQAQKEEAKKTLDGRLSNLETKLCAEAKRATEQLETQHSATMELKSIEHKKKLAAALEEAEKKYKSLEEELRDDMEGESSEWRRKAKYMETDFNKKLEAKNEEMKELEVKIRKEMKEEADKYEATIAELKSAIQKLEKDIDTIKNDHRREVTLLKHDAEQDEKRWQERLTSEVEKAEQTEKLVAAEERAEALRLADIAKSEALNKQETQYEERIKDVKERADEMTEKRLQEHRDIAAAELDEALREQNDLHEQTLRQCLEKEKNNGQDSLDKAIEELEAKVAAEKDEMNKTHNDEVKQVQREKNSVEKKLAKTEADVKRLRGDLEISADEINNLEAKGTALLRAIAITNLRHLRDGFKWSTAHLANQKTLKADMRRKHLKELRAAKAEANANSNEATNYKTRNEKLERAYTDMKIVLTEHGKEILNEHKLRKVVLDSELNDLVENEKDLEQQHKHHTNLINQQKGKIKHIEDQLEKLSKVKSISGGGFNKEAHMERRRLDHELDGIIKNYERLQNQLTNIENRLGNTREQRTEKEDQLSALEASLVTVLVQQQQKLMGIMRTMQKQRVKATAQ